MKKNKPIPSVENALEENALEAGFARWQENLKRDLSKLATASSERTTSSGIPVPLVFTPTHKQLSANDIMLAQGFPGEYPFTRGIHPSMYRGRPWTIRQYSGFGTARETNERYRYLLSQGSTGLSVAFDLPTQMGRDSDHALSRGEVGRVGVAISCLADMEDLFDGIPLAQVSTSMTINATAHVLLGLYLALAKKGGVDWKALRGTVQNDVLKEYIARGTYIYPPRAAMKISVDIFEFCRDEVPQWNTMSISGYHIREAGSTAVQEVAFTLADGIAYVEAAKARGMEVDSFAPRLTFFFNSHNNFLEEVAKFRAARRLWARIMKERFSANDPRSWMLRFHTQTAGSTLTAQQPEVNIVRTAYQALAAVLGGTQSLHTNAFDEALSLPSQTAATLAVRTQQVLLHESGVSDSADPLAGSYAIERLTDEIEERAGQLIKQIDEMGGMLRAIDERFPQSEIEEAAFAYQRAVEGGEQKVVGVNVSPASSDQAIQIPLGLDECTKKNGVAAEQQQQARLAQLRQRRSAVNVKSALEKLSRDAAEDRNILPSVIHAVETEATLGEISDALRAVFGEYRA